MEFAADLSRNVVTENCRNRNPHTSKIGKLLPICLTDVG